MLLIETGRPDRREAGLAQGAPPGRLTEATWDAELAGAIRERGSAVVEDASPKRCCGELDPTDSQSTGT